MPDRRLDPDGLRYLEHWEPVLSDAAQRTLDRLGSTPSVLLDLGAGTGSLPTSSTRVCRSVCPALKAAWNATNWPGPKRA